MIPIVTYHEIGRTPSPIAMAPEAFDQQLREFARLGYRSLTMRELAEALHADARLPARSVAFTFDDGYASFLEEAWPRLQAYGFTATVFLITRCVGARSEAPGASVTSPLLTWKDAAELLRQGCDVGGHGRTHVPLTTRDQATVEDEVRGCRTDIEERLGIRPASFCYPYGAFDAASVAIARRHFDAAVTTHLGYVHSDSALMELPRIDSCYVSVADIARLTEPSFRNYLKVRQLGRTVRRFWRKDWQ